MTDSNKRTTIVKIYESDYALKSDDDQAYVQGIAKHVDDTIRELSKNTAIKSQTKIAILAALNIADDLFQLKKDHQKLLEKLALYEAQSDELCKTIDEQTAQSYDF